jgi:hypothetical protein
MEDLHPLLTEAERLISCGERGRSIAIDEEGSAVDDPGGKSGKDDGPHKACFAFAKAVGSGA